MTAYLTLSHMHGLLPAAWRLHREGHESAFAPWRRRAERCWGVRALPSPLPEGYPRPKAREVLGPWVDRARAGEVGVLWDAPQWAGLFEEAVTQWGTYPVEGVLGPLRLGAWWDGEALASPHLLFVAMGAWPGGLGPWVEGGATLVRPMGWPGVFEELLERAQGALPPQHRGLVQVGVAPGQAAEHAWRITGIGLGWHGLHVHAFLAALGEDGQLGKVLGGEKPVLAHRFSVVVPISVPPWPTDCNVSPAEAPISGLDQAGMGKVFWHDVAVGEDGASLRVAGVDGLVGVARGMGESMIMARVRALGLAGALQVAEKQVRGDVGGQVDQDLAHLEAIGIHV